MRRPPLPQMAGRPLQISFSRQPQPSQPNPIHTSRNCFGAVANQSRGKAPAPTPQNRPSRVLPSRAGERGGAPSPGGHARPTPPPPGPRRQAPTARHAAQRPANDGNGMTQRQPQLSPPFASAPAVVVRSTRGRRLREPPPIARCRPVGPHPTVTATVYVRGSPARGASHREGGDAEVLWLASCLGRREGVPPASVEPALLNDRVRPLVVCRQTAPPPPPKGGDARLLTKGPPDSGGIHTDGARPETFARPPRRGRSPPKCPLQRPVAACSPPHGPRRRPGGVVDCLASQPSAAPPPPQPGPPAPSHGDTPTARLGYAYVQVRTRATAPTGTGEPKGQARPDDRHHLFFHPRLRPAHLISLPVLPPS